MKRTEISNCWTLETIEYDGRKLFTSVKEYSDMVELENGEWLKDLGDGRYHIDNDESSRFAAVYDNEYDEDGELLQGDLIGYCEV